MEGDNMDPDITSLLTGTPWANIVLAVGAVALIVAKFPGIAGNVGTTWTEWLEKQRRAAELRDDADIKDLKRQVDHLTQVVNEIRADIVRRDIALHDHSPWDHKAIQIIASLGGQIDPPPPLWPLAPAPQPANDGP